MVDDNTRLEKLIVHSYNIRLKEKQNVCSMKDVILIDLQENDLHSLDVYFQAINTVVGGRAFGHPEKTQQKYCAQGKTQQEYCATAGCGRSADRWMDFWIRYADRRRFTKHGGLGNRPIDHRRISGRATDLWVELTDQ